MSEERQVRDPIHGFIRLSSDEAEIVETPVFQRLRGIRQLAMANMVYPGALHTRFDHTLGVFHVTRLLCDVFNFPDEDERLVRLSALVHDLGHGPFSHVSEGALELFADREKLKDRLKGDNAAKIHELLTQDLLRSDEAINHLIGGSTISKIISLLSHGYGEPILKSVVSGPLDADKQDYLLRDTYFCGVKYGIFDLQQLHRELQVADDPTQGKQLMISADGVHALEQFVLAKYYLTAQVYSHRVRLITDQMIVRAIKLGIEEDQLQNLHDLYRYDGSDAFVRNYTQWDDSRFLLTFGDLALKDTYCHEIVERLRTRRLLKQVFESTVGQLPESCRELVRDITKPKHRELRRSLEQRLAAVIQESGFTLKSRRNDASHLVVVNSFTLKSVREQSRDDEGPILVRKGADKTTFEEASDLFKSIDEKMVRPQFALYAPVDYDNPAERRSMQVKLREPILRCLEGFGNGQ
jgi:HD superfamily phosphohydrolase